MGSEGEQTVIAIATLGENHTHLPDEDIAKTFR